MLVLTSRVQIASLRYDPANTLRNNDVVITSKRRHFDVITSKWRRFDVVTTLLLRHVFRGEGPNRCHIALIGMRVRFHLCGAIAERSLLGGADFWASLFSCCVFPLWRCGGGGPRRIHRMGPGAIFRSALRSGSGLETIGIDSLEVSKPLFWY